MNRHSIPAMALAGLLLGWSSPDLAGQNLIRLVQKAERSVVRVIAFSEVGVGFGSGFVLNSKGDIGTNSHVLRDDRSRLAELIVVFCRVGGRIEAQSAVFIADDPQRDLALIRAEGLGAPPVVLNVSRVAKLAPVMAIGFPGLMDNEEQMIEIFSSGSRDELMRMLEKNASFMDSTVSDGKVVKVSTEKWLANRSEELKIVHHGCFVSPGSSGGPLFNACGQVIGVNTMLAGDGLATVSRSSHIEEFQKLLRSEKISHRSVSSTCKTAGGGLGGHHLALLLVIAALALIAVYLSMKKPRFVTETLTQYVGRGGSLSRLLRVPGAEDRGERPAPLPESSPASSPPAVHGYSLEGRSPEGRVYRLQFAETDLEKAGNRLIVGRKRDLAHLHLDHETVSRQHAAIVRYPERKSTSLYLENRSTGNVTMVDGKRIEGDVAALRLENGSRVRLGDVELVFRSH